MEINQTRKRKTLICNKHFEEEFDILGEHEYIVYIRACVSVYCLVLYEEELGGQDRVFRGVQVTRSALIGDDEESHIADYIQFL